MSEINVSTNKTKSGTKVKIYYLANESDTVLFTQIAEMLKQIENKISKFVGNEIFDNYTIEVWNQNRSDMPELLKSYDGLTWSWLNPKISQIKIDTKQDLKYVANILSHEFFHSYQRYVGYYDNPLNLIQQELENRKSIFDYKNSAGNIECVKEEMFPEYCRALFGADLAVGENHGGYPIAKNVKGLKDSLLLYKPFLDYIKGKHISDLTFNYKDEDLGFIGIMFKQTETIFSNNTYNNNISRFSEQTSSFYVYINRDAIYHNKNNSWIPFKKFEQVG